MKSFSPACERNRQPILDVLKEVFVTPGVLLEIGSGSGQHAAYFSRQLKHILWQPSDLQENLASISAYRKETDNLNFLAPVILDLHDIDSIKCRYDYMVCINTIHIVSWPLVKNLFTLAGCRLKQGGYFFAYGPYKYSDRELEPSNQQFDAWLKQRDPESGIRSFEDVDRLAHQNQLIYQGDVSMPSNNRSIWWQFLG